MIQARHLRHLVIFGIALSSVALSAEPAAADGATCANILDAINNATGESYASVHAALSDQMTDGAALGKGFPLHQWGTIVDRSGVVCAVVFTGATAGDQWPGSRVISAQKGNTANAFSLDGLAISTANLWFATQPGSSLFGLQAANPVDTEAAYGDNSAANCAAVGCDDLSPVPPPYGEADDPMVSHYVGGTNVFGGGLALYNSSGIIGGLGTSGNSSCADHYISWVVRYNLGLDKVPAGAVEGNFDNIIFDITGSHNNFDSKSGFGHPLCGADPDEKNYPKELSTDYPIGTGPAS